MLWTPNTVSVDPGKSRKCPLWRRTLSLRTLCQCPIRLLMQGIGVHQGEALLGRQTEHRLAISWIGHPPELLVSALPLSLSFLSTEVANPELRDW